MPFRYTYRRIWKSLNELIAVKHYRKFAEQKGTGTAIDGHDDLGERFRVFRFFVLGFLL